MPSLLTRLWSLGLLTTALLAVAIMAAIVDSGTTSAGEPVVTPEAAMSVPAASTPNETIPAPETIGARFPASGAAALPTSGSSDSGVATITADDIMSYLHVRPFRYQVPGDAMPVIEKIELLTAHEAGARVGALIHVASDTRIYLVTLRGEFVVAEEPYTPPTFLGETGYLFFHAETGNLLIEAVRQ